MTGQNVLKRILDTGGTYADMSQKNAEKLVAEFVKAGQVRRKDAEKMVQRLVERGRERTEYLINVIRAEVTKQLGVFAGQLDDIEARVEEMAANLGLGSRMPGKRSTTTNTTPTTTPAARRDAHYDRADDDTGGTAGSRSFRRCQGDHSQGADAQEGSGQEEGGTSEEEVSGEEGDGEEVVDAEEVVGEEGVGEEGARKAVVRGPAAAFGRRHGSPRAGRQQGRGGAGDRGQCGSRQRCDGGQVVEVGGSCRCRGAAAAATVRQPRRGKAGCCT